MRLLFATTAGAGHFGPLEPFASACAREGHEVLVAGQASAAPMAARAGFEFRALGEPSPEEGARFYAGQRQLTPAQAMARAAGELYIGMYARAALPGMLETVAEWRPDVVVRETAEFSSLLAAERLGVPHAQAVVGLSTAIMERMLPLAAPWLDDLRATVGLDPDPDVRAAREVMLTLAPVSLEDPPPARSVRRFRVPESQGAAPVLEGWGERNAPLVYVSFGTEVPSPIRSYFPQLYRAVLDALADLPVRVLVTISDRRDPAELGPVAPSVRVERWVPNAAVLREAAVMVGHGGAGSVLGALAASVPMVLIPLFADQPHNARRVAQLGAGITLDGDPAAASTLGPIVGDVLADPRYRAAARDIADEIARLPPIEDAVSALAALAERESSAG